MDCKNDLESNFKVGKPQIVALKHLSYVLLCLQTAFSQITLAFRCDQYTLKQRLQAEEHARNLAEENIQLELTRGRETLEVLYT